MSPAPAHKTTDVSTLMNANLPLDVTQGVTCNSIMTKWAILVGIDVYPADERLTLHGCLNDVRATRDLLVDRYGFERGQMLEMTSPEMYNPSNLGGLVSATGPTYDNIIRGMRTIQRLCKKGDLIYFHFSGYGSTMPSIVPQFACYPTYFDVVLVPVNVLLAEGQKYLHDIEISCFAQQMVAKGCEVTLVLDCRELEGFPCFDHYRSPQSLFTTEELSSASHGKHRSYASIPLRDTWIWDPSPKTAYTMLTSFNIHGIIFRKSVGTIECQDPATLDWHGFLTAWLHNALHNAVNGTFRALFHSIEMKAQEALNFKQEPESYSWSLALSGNTWRQYPGSQTGPYDDLAPTYPATFEALNATAPNLRVDAGAAHGLRVGDSLIVFDRNPTSKGAKKHATGMTLVGKFTISSVGALSSLAVSAKGVQRRADSLFLVALLVFNTSDCEWPTYCRDLSYLIQRAVPLDVPLSQVMQPSVVVKEDETKEQLKLARATRADAYTRLLHLHHQPQILPRLAHVSIVGGYRYYHDPALVYPDHSKDGTFHLLSGDTIVLNIQNLTDQELHYHILHFDVAYSINVLHPSAEGYSTRIPPHAFQVLWRTRLGIEENLDDGSDERTARHVLKIIITNQPTSFEGHQMNHLVMNGVSKEKRDDVQSLLSKYGDAKNEGPGVDLAQQVHISRDSKESESRLVTLDATWRCYDLVFTVHRNAASLTASLGGI